MTFLLNYLYMTIRNNQLLQAAEETNILRELFLACLDTYVQIMSDWLSKGELNDPKHEFFIKPNEKVFDAQKKISSKKQWRESFVFRTINLRELMQQEGLYSGQEDKMVEISIPIFIRSMMTEILSIGKSIKIVRYLETNAESDKSE